MTKTALVTGASRGIGRALALELGKAGFHVIAAARSQKALEALDDEIKAGGGAATLVPLDLKDANALNQLAAAIHERWGKLDALAACAGVLGELTPVFQARPSMMEEVTQVNFLANYRLIRAMDPLLRASEAGRALFVTSRAALQPRAFWGPYAASKAALEALVTTYAYEVEITPIKVNLFDPGATRTLMRAKAYPGEDPMTLPTPADVAAAMVPLLAPDCSRHNERVRFARD